MAFPLLQKPTLSEERDVPVFGAHWRLCYKFSSSEPHELVAASKMSQVATHLWDGVVCWRAGIFRERGTAAVPFSVSQFSAAYSRWWAVSCLTTCREA